MDKSCFNFLLYFFGLIFFLLKEDKNMAFNFTREHDFSFFYSSLLDMKCFIFKEKVTCHHKQIQSLMCLNIK